MYLSIFLSSWLSTSAIWVAISGLWRTILGYVGFGPLGVVKGKRAQVEVVEVNLYLDSHRLVNI